MTHFVDSLLITNVGQETALNDLFYLLFTIGNIDFEMSVRQDEQGIYQPSYVYHVQLRKKGCPYCQNRGQWCEGLDVHRFELFETLIQFPSIRLYWLFLPHERR